MTSLAQDAHRGLTSRPKALPPKWFYDARGSELFEEITRLPEYYPTRTERAILAARARAIARATRAEALVEIGAGTSEKTRLLVDALVEHGTLRRFVPFDVSEAALEVAVAQVGAEQPSIAVEPLVGDFDHDLGRLPHEGRVLVVFLGSTIGNLMPAERSRFLTAIADRLDGDDHLLLGTDLVKDVTRLEAAYDDDAGITAEFNKNVLRVLNRELDADFALERFAHVAVYDKENEWVEMRLRSLADQRVHVRALDLVVPFAEGEEIRTEISAKFRRDGVEQELAAAGLELVAWWTDPDGDFALSLSRPSR